MSNEGFGTPGAGWLHPVVIDWLNEHYQAIFKAHAWYRIPDWDSTDRARRCICGDVLSVTQPVGDEMTRLLKEHLALKLATFMLAQQEMGCGIAANAITGTSIKVTGSVKLNADGTSALKRTVTWSPTWLEEIELEGEWLR